jgi:hypothetical protein
MLYRNADEALRRRRDELVAERRAELNALPPGLAQAYARRSGRIVAGATGLGFAVALVLTAGVRRAGMTGILEVAWPAVLGVYAVARVLARLHLGRALAQTHAPTENLHGDILRLEELGPRAQAQSMVDALESWSIALPMAALALLLPLSLHYLALTILRASLPRMTDFDVWISLSILLVGHCHIVLAYHSWRLARALRETQDVFALGLVADRLGWRALGVTIGWSLLAGVLLLVPFPIAGVLVLTIAPLLVAVTGVFFIPAMFSRMGRRVREERLALRCPQPAA